MPTVDIALALATPAAILPAPVAALFWLWLLASVVILVVRLGRRVGRSGDDGDLPPLPATAPPPGSFTTAADPFVPPVPPAPSVAPTMPPPAAAPAMPADGGRQGYFAAGPRDDEPTPAEVGAPRPTVAEALSGIRMPCGLSPVVDGTVSIPNPFRVAFLTTEADAATVGSSIGDELERLGYQLSTAAATELVARRPGAELHVVLHPSPAAARRGLDAIFPAAPVHAVGLEIST